MVLILMVLMLGLIADTVAHVLFVFLPIFYVLMGLCKLIISHSATIQLVSKQNAVCRSILLFTEVILLRTTRRNICGHLAMTPTG